MVKEIGWLAKDKTIMENQNNKMNFD